MDNKQKKDYKILYESLSDRYYRLLFITGTRDARAAFFHQIQNFDDQIQVSHKLVENLHIFPAGQRTKNVTEFFTRLGEGSSAIFLSDIEILFDRSLNVDPVKLLKTVARNRIIIVDWPGKIDFFANMLSYAEPGHSEYYCTELTDDILIFDVSDRNSLNKKQKQLTGVDYAI